MYVNPQTRGGHISDQTMYIMSHTQMSAVIPTSTEPRLCSPAAMLLCLLQPVTRLLKECPWLRKHSKVKGWEGVWCLPGSIEAGSVRMAFPPFEVRTGVFSHVILAYSKTGSGKPLGYISTCCYQL